MERLDFETLLRVVIWDYNRCFKDESLDGGIIETSKQIKIGIEEARRMWQMVSLLHRGGPFRHGLVEDVTGHQWSINRYENDILTAGCHRIAYSEMEGIAKQLGWV